MPAGRPRDFDEDALLDTAAQLFRRSGYAAVGMAELCRATGVGTASLYNAFGDKGSLYRRAMDRYGRTANDPIITALKTDDNPLRALQHFVRSWRRHIGAGGEGGCLFTQTLSMADEARGLGDAEVARAYTHRLREVVRMRVADAQAQGLVSARTNAGVVADGLLTLAFGVAVIGRGGMPGAMVEHAVKQGLAMLRP